MRRCEQFGVINILPLIYIKLREGPDYPNHKVPLPVTILISTQCALWSVNPHGLGCVLTCRQTLASGDRAGGSPQGTAWRGRSLPGNHRLGLHRAGENREPGFVTTEARRLGAAVCRIGSGS